MRSSSAALALLFLLLISLGGTSLSPPWAATAASYECSAGLETISRDLFQAEAKGVLDGTWTGILQEHLGTPRQWNFRMVAIQAAGSLSFTGSLSLTGPTNEFYEIQEGQLEGNTVYFQESEGRYFWGTLEGSRISGWAASNCYGCDTWGSFELVRQTETGPALSSQSWLLPIVVAATIAVVALVGGYLLGKRGKPAAPAPREKETLDEDTKEW